MVRLIMLVLMGALMLLSARDVPAAREFTPQGKPPVGEKCRNGDWCGACGVCKKGRCTGGDTGRCGSCNVCSSDGATCIAVADGSGSGPDGNYGCGPDPYGGLQCCSGDCVDTSSSIDNCGACGNACTEGKTCREIVVGVVGCACADSETECNGRCVNLQTDPNNCGECGKVCGSGSCDNGVCDCLTVCDSSGNCTGGEEACGACEICTDGLCEATCGAGQVCCGAGCVDTQNDPANCGGCGSACPAGEQCVAGACQPSCPDGYTPCAGQCVPNTPRGGGECCVWNGQPHACAEGEQCAGAGCCDAGTQVCESANGNAQCCYGDLVCQGGRCCVPDGVLGCPMAGGTGCCSYGN
jgi:hypothetical protein